jgi:hypothetical protein
MTQIERLDQTPTGVKQMEKNSVKEEQGQADEEEVVGGLCVRSGVRAGGDDDDIVFL